ncbi:MAG: DUF3667 domain-containing protein [Chlorobi bacterium]|nr:DUF3667 domain-containing protein [Chlorobiota bacterium]
MRRKKSLKRKEREPEKISLMNESNTIQNCLNCVAVLYENYCPSCGQKKIDTSDRSLKAFFTHFFNEFFNWDSKFFSSVKYVLTRPGYLTREYINGRMASYISPIKLYLCMSLVTFLISTQVVSDQYSEMELDKSGTDNVFADWVSEIRVSKDIQEETFKASFNSELNDKLPIYVIIMVFLFSLPLKIVEHKRFYVEHLVFSLHFFTFVLFCITIDTFLSLIDDDITFISVFLIPFIYLLIAFKRVYKQNWIITIFETGIFSVYYTILMAMLVIAAVLVSAVIA